MRAMRTDAGTPYEACAVGAGMNDLSPFEVLLLFIAVVALLIGAMASAKKKF